MTDPGLTAHGEAESRALAPRLRARQTCELAGLGAASRIDPDLAEWDYGDDEGRRSRRMSSERPGWNIWRDGCPGGESPAEVGARADRLIQRLCARQDSVVLFSHGQFGAALAERWIGLALVEGQHFPLHTASASLLGIDPHHPDRRTIRLWNEVPCLPPRDLPDAGVPLR